MLATGAMLVPTRFVVDELLHQIDALPRYAYEKGRMIADEHARALKLAVAKGVRIATGADNYYDERSINRISIEVEEFVRLGMSEFEALQTATVNSAELLQLQDTTGRITAGYEADMIVVPANPLSQIGALQDVLMVMSNGQIVIKRFPFAVAEESAR